MNRRQVRELVIMVIVLILGIAAGWMYRTYTMPGGKENAAAPPSSKGAPVAAKPINPKEVVARLNGQDITRGELEKYYRVMLMTGEMDEASISEDEKLEQRRNSLQQIIDERLLWEAAPKKGITISKEEIEAIINNEVLPSFKDKAEMEASLKKDLGITYDELVEMLSRQELGEKMRQELSKDITITDEELNKEIEAYREVMKSHQGGPVAEPTREEIRKELFDIKVEKKYSTWLQALRADAKVEILDPSLKEEAVEVYHKGAPQPSGEPAQQSKQEEEKSGGK